MEHSGTVHGPGALRLRPPRNLVSPRAVGWWRTQACATVATLLVPLLVGIALWDGARTVLLVVTAVVVGLGAGYVAVMPGWRYRVHRWETTDDAVYTSAGWLSQEWRIAPMSRIQTVDTARGPVQQLFGLSTVTVTTASAAGPLRVEGLDAGLARELVEQLTARTQAAPGDAT